MKTNLSHAESANSLGVPSRTSLFSAAAIRWVSMGVSVLLGLLVTPIIVARLGKESYGLWGLAASFLGFYGVFDLGLASATSRYLGNAIGARDLRQLNSVASTARLLLTGTAGLTIVLALLIAAPAKSMLQIPQEYAGEFVVLLMLSALSMSVMMVTSVYSGALLASEDFLWLGCVSTGANLLRPLLGLAAVMSGAGVIGLAAVTAAITLTTKGLELLHCRRRLPQMKVRFMDFDVAIARKLLGFGAAAYVVILAEIVRSKLDIMIVTRVGGLAQAGLYAVALTVFRYITSAILTAAGVSWPRLNRLQGQGDEAGLVSFFLRVSRLTAACAALIAGVFLGLAPLLLTAWVGPGYEQSATVLRILVGGYFLDFATNPGIGSLYATAHHRYFAGQTMVEALASFTLAFLLGREFGMTGVALGIVMPILVVKLTIQPWYVTRILSIPLRGYWLRSIGMPALAVAALSIGLHWTSSLWIHSGILASLLAAPVCVGPALCAIWLLVLAKGDRLYLGSYWGRILARCAIPRRVRNSRSVLPWEK